MNLANSSHVDDDNQDGQKVTKHKDGANHDAEEDGEPPSGANNQKEEEEVETVMLARCTLATEHLPLTIIKEWKGCSSD